MTDTVVEELRKILDLLLDIRNMYMERAISEVRPDVKESLIIRTNKYGKSSTWLHKWITSLSQPDFMQTSKEYVDWSFEETR